MDTMAGTLTELLESQSRALPDHEAIVFPGSRTTYAGLVARADVIAERLRAEGVERGDRVGILLNASTDYVAAIFGIVKLGAVAVPINARFRQAQIKHVVVHSGMKVLISEAPLPGAPDFPQLLAEAFPAYDKSWGRVDFSEAPELQAIVEVPQGTAAGAVPSAEVKPEDTALLVYTSGTTSAPKGAMLSHRALLLVAQALRTRMRITSSDRIWTAIPMFHGGGIDYMLGSVAGGATFVHPGYFDVDRSLEMLSGERITIALPAFETLWLPLINHPDFAKHDLSAIRVVLSVGVPERLRELIAALPGATLVNCVAMTEASAFISLSELDEPLESRLETGGKPLPGVECRIIDPDTGKDLPPGEPGELLFRGPNLFSGYFRDEEGTAQAIDADGWFHTGDVCRMDAEGRLTFVGRLKDMLKVGGENVAAAEIEEFIAKHPAVEIVQVVAAPDDRYTEVPAAFIQLKRGATCTEQEIIDFCLGRVAAFHVPRYVRFVTEWPMSGTKIRKVDLRKAIADELRERGITMAPKLPSRWAARK